MEKNTAPKKNAIMKKSNAEQQLIDAGFVLIGNVWCKTLSNMVGIRIANADLKNPFIDIKAEFVIHIPKENSWMDEINEGWMKLVVSRTFYQGPEMDRFCIQKVIQFFYKMDENLRQAYDITMTETDCPEKV